LQIECVSQIDFAVFILRTPEMHQRLFKAGELQAAKPGKAQGVSAVDYEYWTPDQVAAVQRATEAYVQQGMSPEDAVEQVVKDIDAGAMFDHEPLMRETEKPQLKPETAPRTEEFKKWSDGAPVVLNSVPAEFPSAFTKLYLQQYGHGRGRLRGVWIVLLI